MLAWFMANIGSISVGLLLFLVVFFIIRKQVRDRKQGKSTCGCDCGQCGGSCGACHKQ